MITGNLSSDKKGSSFNALLGRGVSVTAKCHIPEDILQRTLNMDSLTMSEMVRYASRLGERTGEQGGFNANIANILGGMFTALGQDIACVHESAIACTQFAKSDSPDGGIDASIYMPCLVVGTIGGGTMLPTQRECLEMIDCYGPGKVRRLAEIIAGYCLALDMSTYSAVASGDFADAHDRLGRNRPDEKK